MLGGTLDAAGEATKEPLGSVGRLVRGSTPGAALHFDTPIVGPNVWQPLQSQRVRYFNRPKPAGDAGTDGNDAGASQALPPGTP